MEIQKIIRIALNNFLANEGKRIKVKVEEEEFFFYIKSEYIKIFIGKKGSNISTIEKFISKLLAKEVNIEVD